MLLEEYISARFSTILSCLKPYATNNESKNMLNKAQAFTAVSILRILENELNSASDQLELYVLRLKEELHIPEVLEPETIESIKGILEEVKGVLCRY